LKRIYCTFSGSAYDPTTERIVKDAPGFGIDEVRIYDDKWLTGTEFYRLNHWLWEIPRDPVKERRGFGWYAWKPYVIMEEMERQLIWMNDPDLQPPPIGRSRGPGGGRKRAEVLDPALAADLDALVEPETRGDPMNPLRWTTKSLSHLVGKLVEQGHQCTENVVARLLHEAGYSLQGNAKTVEGRQHPDRDAQFVYLNEQVKAALAAGQPVVSVDCKKKELVGNFKNVGKEWRPAGDPVKVNVHDFPDRELGKAIPYGVYDIGANTGWVSVGTDHDTAAFAVNTLRTWWNGQGQAAYPQAAANQTIAAERDQLRKTLNELEEGRRRYARNPPLGRSA